MDFTGVYDVYIDLPQNKLTVVGRVDPETLIKTIKKARKVATICSYTEPSASEPPPTEPEADSSRPAADAADQQPSEAPPADATPPKDAPLQENQAPEETEPMGHQFLREPPYSVTHSYNTYRPSPYISTYGYLPSPPQEMIYHTFEAYGDGFHQNQGSDGNQITSMLSDENPNACRIV